MSDSVLHNDSFWFGVYVSAVVIFVWVLVAAITGDNTNYWEKVNKSCYVHITQDKNAFLTPGVTQPEQRTIFCKSKLVGVSE